MTEAQVRADLRARIAGGADPSRLYVLAICPAAMSGAPQVVRGPYDGPRDPRLGEVWCFWRADAPSPGGWPSPVRICTKRTLPRWARQTLRGAR